MAKGPSKEDNQRAANKMQQCAHYVQSQIPNGFGFCIMVFTFGEVPVKMMHWVSNCNRADMIKSLREQADRLEQGLGSGPWDN